MYPLFVGYKIYKYIFLNLKKTPFSLSITIIVVIIAHSSDNNRPLEHLVAQQV